ncbi:PD-(D/E)XK nuclease family protein [Candidatus Contendibacter odensensis]|uniref:DUF3782 domain-containing protein n=1 Tax=Candidatus Contendobacter odensis Run_B_J11 TaxID=1400861 RepID=A0A7U7GAD3_9GAMM|nr:DUF3782 domain-containing protein [Candidatus Contendobacter odensis]CDH44689.1 conserved hypothetical protein [Candidatus Contendobacter odensis Run_B_J11]
MNTELLKETIKRELPGLLRDDPALRAYILDLTRQEYAGREETQDRFYEMLAELRRDREERAREWREYQDEQHLKWEEQNRKWDEQNQQLKLLNTEQNRKWEEQNRKWDGLTQERSRKWEEQDRQWKESGQRFDRMHEEIMAQAKKQDRAIGALGARWGLQSEAAFRNALAGILEQNFGVQVLNVNEYDDQGEVFGRPDQVELDVIIKNGLLLICELKSSTDKAGMYIFERKARFYEKRHQRQANRRIVISPMIDPKAKRVAEQLGIEIYSDSTDVEMI